MEWARSGGGLKEERRGGLEKDWVKSGGVLKEERGMVEEGSGEEWRGTEGGVGSHVSISCLLCVPCVTRVSRLSHASIAYLT